MTTSLYVLLSCVLAVSLATCQIGGAPDRVETSTDTTAGAISFELAGPGGAALIVPIYLNGTGPHRFVLDTGATLTCIKQTLSDSLDLPERTGQFGFGAGVSSSGSVELVGVDSLRIGETKAFDLTACELGLTQLEQTGLEIDGLLGLNFLKEFRVALDFGTETLHLEQL